MPDTARLCHSLLSQVQRRKDPTAEHDGYVSVLWFTRCCARHERAEKVDKWIKYSSSVVFSFILCVLCFYIISVGVRAGANQVQTETYLHRD